MTQQLAPRRGALRAPTVRDRLLLSACLLGFGLLAVVMGQGNSWDLRNYHLYDGWAFWTGRGDLDFAAAQLQTYFNPLLSTATYLLFTHTAPWLSAFALGLLQGANLLPVYVLAHRLLPVAPDRARPRLALAVALVGTLGATQLSELGGSIGDDLVSLPVLSALALVLRPGEIGARRAGCAGLLVGVATGLKLTAAPFAVGLFATVVLLSWRQRDRWIIAALCAAAAAAGFLATDGFWMLRLYREFGNPLHPMFAGVFADVYPPPVPLRDTRFAPQSASEWIAYPLVWLAFPHRVSDAWFFDLRVPLAFVLLPLLLVRHAGIDRRLERALLLALALAYLCWLALFGVYRYLAPIEMLAPLLVLLALQRVPGKAAAVAPTVLLALLLVCVRPPGWGHLRAYGARFLETRIPDLPGLDHATVVLAEDEPLAFLALAFPPGTVFVRIAGNLLGPPYPEYAMDREAARRIAGADGPLYALLRDPASPAVAEALARQHLALDTPCAAIQSNLDARAIELCPLRRTEARSAKVLAMDATTGFSEP